MNLLSTPVLGAAALLAGPTLWQGLVTGVVPLEHALTRYAITVALVWIALSAVVMLVESTGPRPALQQQSADDLEEEAGRT
jgi:hypothetical protein